MRQAQLIFWASYLGNTFVSTRVRRTACPRLSADAWAGVIGSQIDYTVKYTVLKSKLRIVCFTRAFISRLGTVYFQRYDPIFSNFEDRTFLRTVCLTSEDRIPFAKTPYFSVLESHIFRQDHIFYLFSKSKLAKKHFQRAFLGEIDSLIDSPRTTAVWHGL